MLTNRQANRICRGLGMIVVRAHPGFWIACAGGVNGLPHRDWLLRWNGSYTTEVAEDAIREGLWPPKPVTSKPN